MKIFLGTYLYSTFNFLWKIEAKDFIFCRISFYCLVFASCVLSSTFSTQCYTKAMFYFFHSMLYAKFYFFHSMLFKIVYCFIYNAYLDLDSPRCVVSWSWPLQEGLLMWWHLRLVLCWRMQNGKRLYTVLTRRMQKRTQKSIL